LFHLLIEGMKNPVGYGFALDYNPLKNYFGLGSFYRPSMWMPIVWPFSQFYPGSVKLRIMKLIGLQAPQEESDGATPFCRMEDLLFLQASVHMAQVTHSQKGHKGAFP
jgi:hypothetical protein